MTRDLDQFLVVPGRQELGALLSDEVGAVSLDLFSRTLRCEVLPWQLASGPSWGVGPGLPGLGV